MRTCYYTLAPSEQHILLNAVFCEDRLAKIPVLYARLIRSSHTQNGVERFWNGPVHELYSLKASRMCKVHTSSHEITNKPYVSSNCENTGKTVTADFTTNYDAETNTSLTEKIENVREHNSESGANNSELDEDTARSDLNSKVKYLSSALPLNVLFLLLVFIGFNACKVRFGISYIITIIIVQEIVNVGLLFAWSCMCLEEDNMNTLDDCDLLEKVVNMNIMMLQCQCCFSVNKSTTIQISLCKVCI